eukprot:GHVQ01043625.1.p1 GENE.GHVQ01043625.1~~GHVQ01043625.1.p1  ORF type:complete len:192 (+),score=2.29 GHVQ01043625.1:272-847(+)
MKEVMIVISAQGTATVVSWSLTDRLSVFLTLSKILKSSIKQTTVSGCESHVSCYPESHDNKIRLIPWSFHVLQLRQALQPTQSSNSDSASHGVGDGRVDNQNRLRGQSVTASNGAIAIVIRWSKCNSLDTWLFIGNCGNRACIRQSVLRYYTNSSCVTGIDTHLFFCQYRRRNRQSFVRAVMELYQRNRSY